MRGRVSYPQRQYNERRSAWLRRNAKMAGLIALGGLTLATFLSGMCCVAFDGHLRYYLLGSIHAVVVAAVLHLLQSAFLAQDRAAILQLRGAWGEENTRSELARARRRRLIWGWVDSIELQSGDLDHVVVTRHGGLVALDSKWRNEISAGHVRAMADSARKVKLRAEGLTRTLLSTDRGARHRARGQSISVSPAVVVWGAARHEVPDEAVVDGVRFLDGRQLVRWLATLDGEPVTRDAGLDVLKRLRDWQPTSPAADSVPGPS